MTRLKCLPELSMHGTFESDAVALLCDLKCSSSMLTAPSAATQSGVVAPFRMTKWLRVKVTGSISFGWAQVPALTAFDPERRPLDRQSRLMWFSPSMKTCSSHFTPFFFLPGNRFAPSFHPRFRIHEASTCVRLCSSQSLISMLLINPTGWFGNFLPFSF